ncbi:L,D-transpeptidase family protein [Mucilaginibacter sp.]|uniref:L,D-transpeptidase family protein n=1 Tax=Mucilaginibacter sp. TaxID=1882438 RepID=UPI003D12C55D
MINFAFVKRPVVFLLILPVFILTFQGCKKKRSETADFFFKKTHNKVYQDYNTDDFARVFKKVLNNKRSSLHHSDFILDHYSKNHYKPELVMDHLFNNDLLTITNYYFKANEHGLDAGMFDADKLRTLIYEFNQKGKVKSLDEIYHEIAELEITSANSLINYSNALQFGVINPKSIFERYFMATKRPDSLSMLHVFHLTNVQAFLDSIQPKSPQYLAMQKALLSGYVAPGRSLEETKRILLVNLERFRWRNKPFENKYVIVNIPDFMLNVVDSGRSVLKMKVCVGQGRNMDNANTIVAYNDTAKDDKPYEHETPILNSLIHSVDVNPIWNIPRSIANKEILVEAAKDRFYLSNKNIDVYKDDKLVEDPEDIDWTKVTKQNSEYDFKQKPGADNSLGKIKFMFNNKSSVYLHDTPAKYAFYKKMRAVSHGCVRLGDPQGLALNLFGPGDKYDEISKDMNEDNPNPTSIYLPKRVPVYINYVTCWNDEDGNLQFRNDVYGLDIVLYDHLMRLVHPLN